MAHPSTSGFRGVFRTDDASRGAYAEAAGIGRVVPQAVAVPSDADDVVALVRWASETRTPLVPRGSGSSMAGGAIGAGVIVDLSRLRRLDAVNVGGRSVRAEPGVLRDEVDRAARATGLRFPVDPSSGAFCTVGGMASTNAAGAHSLRFGSTRRWVRALDCVFADGTRAELRRGEPPPAGMPALERFLEWSAARSGRADDHPGVCKESSGYALRSFETTGELVDLLVGSEGTLTLFVGIELDLAPTAGAASSILGAFASLDAAVAAAIQVRHAGATACELLDRTFLDVAAAGGGAHVGIDAGTEAVLLAEVEGDDAAGAAAAAAEVKRIFETTGATTVRVALDVVAATELWELRHAASPILSRLDPALKSMQFIEDAAVPPDRLADYVRGVRAALERHDTRGVIFGHAGDAHVHVNPLVDVRRPDWRARVERILHEVTGLVASLAGTVSGEHGDGRLRAPLLPQVWSAAALADFAAVKRAFDPRGVLNPGVKVALPRQASLETIKYDPDAPPLPSGSRAVLDVVERERGYARFRLDVLDSVS